MIQFCLCVFLFKIGRLGEGIDQIQDYASKYVNQEEVLQLAEMFQIEMDEISQNKSNS